MLLDDEKIVRYEEETLDTLMNVIMNVADKLSKEDASKLDEALSEYTVARSLLHSSDKEKLGKTQK